MMDANLMRLMSLEHLLAVAEAEQDSLTRTPLETELIRRINELQDETPAFKAEDGTEFGVDELNKLWKACIDDLDNTVALLDILRKHQISLADSLDDLLALAKFGTDLADKLSDETLTELTVFFNQLAERK